jgi:aminomethyltransferase
MGHAYPMPGLHAKYYDQEMVPLVEVVHRDTCGRHDAFAMACTEKILQMIWAIPVMRMVFDQFQSRIERLRGCRALGWRSISSSTPALMITA